MSLVFPDADVRTIGPGHGCEEEESSRFKKKTRLLNCI